MLEVSSSIPIISPMGRGPGWPVMKFFAASVQRDGLSTLSDLSLSITLRGCLATSTTEQVSVVIKSEEPSVVGRRLMSAWNNPESGLHSGAMSGLIDFSKVWRTTVLKMVYE